MAVAYRPERKSKRWPAGRVPIYDGHGCGRISCVDSTTPAGAVWLRDSGTWHRMNETLFDYFAQVLKLPADG